MGNYFEPEFVEEVQQRADIVSVIQDYVNLKKMGSSTYMAKCPFHDEKTPSFGVNKSKQYFNCFGCSASGSVFKFLMLHLGMSFPDAVEMVANRYGIPVPEQKAYSAEVTKRREEKKKANISTIAMNNAMAQLWKKNLTENKPITQYLRTRGVSEETQSVFGLGFSDDKWDSDCAYLLAMQAEPKDLIEAGLASQGETGSKLYDRFRNRIIFPIRDEKGGLVAFGGRVLGDEQPKYLNSPETPAYVKGNHLYGLYENREAIRKSGFVILVEGYMDLISLYEAGIRNVVASLGTALTDSQARILGRHTKNVVINYDGDKAGIKAARRAITPLYGAGMNVKVFVLPGKQDPDDFVRANGAKAYHIARKKGYLGLDFFLKESDLETKSDRIMEAVELIGSLGNEIERRDAFDQTMAFHGVTEAETKSGLWNIVKANSYKLDTVREYLEQIDAPKPKVAEARLLELMAARDEIRDAIIPNLDETDYSNLVLKRLFEEIIKGNKIKDSRLKVPVIDADEPLDEFLEEAAGCVQVLRAMSIEDEIKDTKELIAKSEKDNDLEQLAHYVEKHLYLVKTKRSLQYAVQ